jgi:hypothetical protein
MQKSIKDSQYTDCNLCKIPCFIEVHYAPQQYPHSPIWVKYQATKFTSHVWYPLCFDCARGDITKAKKNGWFSKILIRRLGTDSKGFEV